MVELEDRWLSVVDIPAHRVGRLRKFKKEQEDAWVEAGGVDSDPVEENRRRHDRA